MEKKAAAVEGVATNKSLVTQITAMYMGRKAFTETLQVRKVRKVLQHNVRATERVYDHGEEVYYRHKDRGDGGDGGPMGGH